eukprot:CAMPEP_0198368004 /NCGR_PEP_ID=MMETSP1450-20131203/155478_1 /TAXON_ID=753684 ORGANISM="Madagascaria erythrocladiodes, Strain CCMP3234" /NCGR_SAMPLE_ID=MMETSP1450 /ASSEMBLY_ACC=CAM_ASM_001115 /LENGTH=171 /DNA_ID=CAMNT_0044075499 /DNA_START=16 /DNA_END=531 /DNA_ORIENTATION=+
MSVLTKWRKTGLKSEQIRTTVCSPRSTVRTLLYLDQVSVLQAPASRMAEYDTRTHAWRITPATFLSCSGAPWSGLGARTRRLEEWKRMTRRRRLEAKYMVLSYTCMAILDTRDKIVHIQDSEAGVARQALGRKKRRTESRPGRANAAMRLKGLRVSPLWSTGDPVVSQTCS